MVSGSCQGKLVARQGPTHNTSLAELIPGGYEGRVEELAVSVGRGSGADGEEMRRCGSPPPPPRKSVTGQANQYKWHMKWKPQHHKSAGMDPKQIFFLRPGFPPPTRRTHSAHSLRLSILKGVTFEDIFHFSKILAEFCTNFANFARFSSLQGSFN